MIPSSLLNYLSLFLSLIPFYHSFVFIIYFFILSIYWWFLPLCIIILILFILNPSIYHPFLFVYFSLFSSLHFMTPPFFYLRFFFEILALYLIIFMFLFLYPLSLFLSLLSLFLIISISFPLFLLVLSFSDSSSPRGAPRGLDHPCSRWLGLVCWGETGCHYSGGISLPSGPGRKTHSEKGKRWTREKKYVREKSERKDWGCEVS